LMKLGKPEMKGVGGEKGRTDKGPGIARLEKKTGVCQNAFKGKRSPNQDRKKYMG